MLNNDNSVMIIQIFNSSQELPIKEHHIKNLN